MSGQKPYLRSMPFRPPESVLPPVPAPAPPPAPLPQAAPPRTHGQLFALAAYGLLFLAGLGLGSVFPGKFTLRSAADPGGKVDAEQPAGKKASNSPSPGKEARPAPVEIPAAMRPRNPGVTLPLRQGPQPHVQSVPKAAALPPMPEVVVEALGGLTAAHLYQTYLNIGLLADAVEGEVYETAAAKKMLATVAGLTAAVEVQLAVMGKLPLKDDEKITVEQARQITTLLSAQARELRAYWDTGEKEHTARFHKARQEAWAGIKSLLNLRE